jgi:hypothetical protein
MISICTDCVYFNEKEYGTCKAFPDGIPIAIASNEFDHNFPYENDNGIRFKPIKELTNSKPRG